TVTSPFRVIVSASVTSPSSSSGGRTVSENPEILISSAWIFSVTTDPPSAVGTETNEIPLRPLNDSDSEPMAAGCSVQIGAFSSRCASFGNSPLVSSDGSSLGSSVSSPPGEVGSGDSGSVGSSVGSSLGSSDGSSLGSSVGPGDRKSTRLNSSHVSISYAVFCLKKKNYS